jgi:hypothetical protein
LTGGSGLRRRRLLWIGLGLLLAELVLVAMVTLRRSEPAALDWDEIVPDDPRVAGIFATLEHDGLQAAMDSLVRQAAADSVVLRGGHQLAHALGRRSLASNNGDPSVIAQCRPEFGAGCFHGVVEAFLNASGGIDMPVLERMCTGAGGTRGPGVVYECMHGLGHGVVGVLGLDYERALGYCDALSRPRFDTSCQEGVFMEAIDNAIADSTAASRPGHGGATAHGADAHTHHNHGGAPGSRIQVASGDPFSPCAAISDVHAASCWIFQGFLILRAARFDPAVALRVCDAAPEGRAARCYQSIGHQLTGLLQRDDAWTLRQCGKGRPEMAAECAAGATLALNAIDWSGAHSARFCGAAPAGWRPTCYDAAAASLTYYAPVDQVERFCAGSGPEYAGACRQAAAAAERT